MRKPKITLSSPLLPCSRAPSDYRSGKPAGTGMRVTQNLYHRVSCSRYGTTQENGCSIEVEIIIRDLTGYFCRDAGAIMGGRFSKIGKFENLTIKNGKRTNLRTINLYRPWGMNPRGRPTEIQIACLESRAEMPAFQSEIEQVCEEGGVIHPS